MVYMYKNMNYGETTFKSIGHFVKANYNYCIYSGIFSGIIWWPISNSANDRFLTFIFEPNSILIMLKNEKQPMHGQWGSNTSILVKQHNEFEEWKCNLLDAYPRDIIFTE